jgi:hypothetical protein
MRMTDEEFDRRSEEAFAVARRRQAEAEARHAAFHGHPLRYGRVGRRRGYRGETVCLDCYYAGRKGEWPG